MDQAGDKANSKTFFDGKIRDCSEQGYQRNPDQPIQSDFGECAGQQQAT